MPQRFSPSREINTALAKIDRAPDEFSSLAAKALFFNRGPLRFKFSAGGKACKKPESGTLGEDFYLLNLTSPLEV